MFRELPSLCLRGGTQRRYSVIRHMQSSSFISKSFTWKLSNIFLNHYFTVFTKKKKKKSIYWVAFYLGNCSFFDSPAIIFRCFTNFYILHILLYLSWKFYILWKLSLASISKSRLGSPTYGNTISTLTS